MEEGYEYIHMSWLGSSKSGKTQVYGIYNSRSGDQIGEVKWFGRWRQYAFFPEDGSIYSAGCMFDIVHFIKGLMKERSLDRVPSEVGRSLV